MTATKQQPIAGYRISDPSDPTIKPWLSETPDDNGYTSEPLYAGAAPVAVARWGVAAWMTPEGDRVVTAETMDGARKDGGASLSSLRPYTVALVRGAVAPALEAPAAPAGWKLVPAKPTDAMLGAAQKAWLADPLRRSSTLYAAALAAAPQAPAAPAEGEVLVEVIGLTGSGKSAICGEIEILCRALGLDVSWPDGDPEKNMTHAEWTAAIEAYKPRVRIVERNVPRQSNGGPAK